MYAVCKRTCPSEGYWLWLAQWQGLTWKGCLCAFPPLLKSGGQRSQFGLDTQWHRTNQIVFSLIFIENTDELTLEPCSREHFCSSRGPDSKIEEAEFEMIHETDQLPYLKLSFLISRVSWEMYYCEEKLNYSPSPPAAKEFFEGGYDS